MSVKPEVAAALEKANEELRVLRLRIQELEESVRQAEVSHAELIIALKPFVAYRYSLTPEELDAARAAAIKYAGELG